MEALAAERDRAARAEAEAKARYEHLLKLIDMYDK